MQLAHAFLWKHSYKGLKLAQLLGQLGVLLTLVTAVQPSGKRAGKATAAPPVQSMGST